MTGAIGGRLHAPVPFRRGHRGHRRPRLGLAALAGELLALREARRHEPAVLNRLVSRARRSSTC